MKIQVEGNPNLYRDINSGAIVNGSDAEFQRYLELKETKLKEIKEMNQLKSQVSEIDQLKTDVNEMKDMMKLIISKLQSNS
jgi:sugar-specific transcriptional regulator TrmB